MRGWQAILVGASLLAGQQASEPGRSDSVTLAVEQAVAGDWRAMDPQTVFRQGDTIRFQFSSTFAGYLYVLNRNSSGEYEWLFPSRATGTQNRVLAGSGYLVPATQGGFRIQGKAGFDSMYWIITPVPLKDWQSMPPQEVVSAEPTPAQGAGSLLPRCQEGILRARGQCLDERAGPRAPSASRIATGSGELRSRDLVFERRTRSTEITAPAMAGAPFIYEFRLAHR